MLAVDWDDLIAVFLHPQGKLVLMIFIMKLMMMLRTMTKMTMMLMMMFSDSSRHSDSYSSSDAEAVRLGKDEKLAREAGITFDVKVMMMMM